MLIQVKKFGSTLVSRPSGREALLAFTPTLDELKENEKIVIDFEGVAVLTPSWIDEFLTPLIRSGDRKIELVNIDNPSIRLSLETLSKQYKIDYLGLAKDKK